MKLQPVLTEKSTKLAEDGLYTFIVPTGMTKYQIKKAVGETFGVTVRRVRTETVSGITKKNFRGRKRNILPQKKAMVVLSEKDKIDLFETKKSKK